MKRCPACEATRIGDAPPEVRASMRAPASHSNETQSTAPEKAAAWSGVAPGSSPPVIGWSTFGTPASSRMAVHSGSLAMQAMNSGDRPRTSAAQRSAFALTSALAMAALPRAQHTWSAVSAPCPHVTSRLTPNAISSSTHARWLCWTQSTSGVGSNSWASWNLSNHPGGLVICSRWRSRPTSPSLHAAASMALAAIMLSHGAWPRG
mmetsp:Transcript_14618/g.31680  ORF Transcript_14618/g.31680 Transcript_14618/m.31680 type:complete len:206 (+) Transcript_14618:774-1391(+)